MTTHLEAIEQQFKQLESRTSLSGVLKVRIEIPLLDALDTLADALDVDRSKLVRLVLTNFVEGAMSSGGD